jgi:hypothetical protein
MSKIITLTKGKETIVDDEDFEELSKHKWFITKKYASRHSPNGFIYMHRVIMKTPDGMETDHINGDYLDNRHENLRICTTSENQRNKRIQANNTSGYKGVCWDKKNKKWCAQIKCNGISKKLGRFENIFDAARSYDIAAKKLFGEFARTNF